MGRELLIDWITVPRGDGWEDLEPDAIIWLDVRKLEAAFSKAPAFYVGHGGSGAGQASRYKTVGRYISSGRPVWMAHLGFGEGSEVVFTDGRHRFAWVRDHGALAVAVTCDPNEAMLLAARLGADINICRVFIADDEVL